MKTLDFSSPRIMGILNVTPDSFSDGGCYTSPESALRHALEMEADGADIIDVGAQSTRPGSVRIAPEEEWTRLQPVLESVCRQVQVPVSVDTFYPQVARSALAAGCSVVNDVSGKVTSEMASVVKATGTWWILTEVSSAPGDPAKQVAAGLMGLARQAEALGISHGRLILDPGFGFGKDCEQCERILADLDTVTALPYPVLAGMSRKRMIGAMTGEADPRMRDAGSAAAHAVAVIKGAAVVRVHNVRMTRQVLDIFQKTCSVPKGEHSFG